MTFAGVELDVTAIDDAIAADFVLRDRFDPELRGVVLFERVDDSPQIIRMVTL